MKRSGTKKQSLGRGLSALLGDEDIELATLLSDKKGDSQNIPQKEKTDENQDQSKPSHDYIPIKNIHPNLQQPRKDFNNETIDELVKSISHQGIIQPIIVRRHPTNKNNYEIVAGERRWRAAQRAKITEVPVIIRDLNEKDMFEISLMENIHREDLTPLEEAEGYQKLIKNFNYTQETLAQTVGKSRSHIANMIRLLSLPENLKSMLRDNSLSTGHARALLGVNNSKILAKKIIDEDLNVRQTEKMIQELKSDNIDIKTKKTSPQNQRKLSKNRDIQIMEESLGNNLGLAVQIHLHKNGKGILTIKFHTLEELDDLALHMMQDFKHR